MIDLEQLFYIFLNIKVDSNNRETDVLTLNATPEEVVYLLVYLRDNLGINLNNFYGDVPITFELLQRYLNEKNSDH